MQTIQSNAIKYLTYLILNNWKFDKNQIQTFSTLKNHLTPKKHLISLSMAHLHKGRH